MTLIELVKRWDSGLYADNASLKKDFSSIDIFEPIIGDNELDETIYSVGDGNSWFEVVNELVYPGHISVTRYKELRDKLKTL